jgi:translocation and assembly module TamB
VSDVHGQAAGRIAMRGTFSRPSLTGGILLSQASMKLTATGMKVNDNVGSVRMAHDTVYVDSIVGNARGEVRLNGQLAVGSWREPAFNLELVTHNAELLNNQRGRVRADVNVSLNGPFNRAMLNGQVTLTQGVIRPPEPTGRHVISAGDPDLFNVVDTALVADPELFPTTSPLTRNLRADLTVSINRSTWVRTKDANVEIFTDYPITLRMRQSTLALTGAIGTDRGEYTFLSKRFAVTRGSATFVGGSDLNPTLQVTGEYQVAMASGPAMNVRVLIGGTLRRPKLSLETDAQPPRSQSELLSLLAFGRSTTSLLQGEGSSMTSGSSGDLVGAGASIAVQRLAGVALGVLVDEAETELGKGLGADQFNIIPGDSPEILSTSNNGFNAFIADTRIEAGKYLNPRTFLGIQTQSLLPGARIEYRTPTGWRYNAFVQPTVILKQPSLSLSSQSWKTTQSFGAFIIREWRF